jgi:LysM repeat protein
MQVHLPVASLARARELLPLLASGKEEPNRKDDEPTADAAAPEAPMVISRGLGKRTFYRVREGDTLASLGRQYSVPVEVLASDNALDPTGTLKPGMILAIRLPEPSASPPEPAPPPVRDPPKTKKRR